MKLWRIWQTENSNYDTYDSAVVAAETEMEARCIHPDGSENTGRPPFWALSSDWAPPDAVSVRYIGEAAPGIEKGVICVSFNAG